MLLLSHSNEISLEEKHFYLYFTGKCPSKQHLFYTSLLLYLFPFSIRTPSADKQIHLSGESIDSRHIFFLE